MLCMAWIGLSHATEVSSQQVARPGAAMGAPPQQRQPQLSEHQRSLFKELGFCVLRSHLTPLELRERPPLTFWPQFVSL
eukprot:COSAG06_NODE_1439_length_9457_cov_9.548942_5_plen_79_part_00